MISDQNQKQLSGKINGGNLHSIVPELFKLPADLRKYSELRFKYKQSVKLKTKERILFNSWSVGVFES